MSASALEQRRRRADLARDVVVFAGFACLFAGAWLLHSLGAALVVLGGVLAGLGLWGTR